VFPQEIIDEICKRLDGLHPKTRWGEVSLFYNPGEVFPHGIYCCTIKNHDGDHDRASNLDRAGVFRLAMGLTPETYLRLFGPRPARPARGGVVEISCDFTRLNVLMPHPIYAWMGWAQLLNPSRERFESIFPLIEEAHRAAALKFMKKSVNHPSRRIP
jgi:hypothetical protein